MSRQRWIQIPGTGEFLTPEEFAEREAKKDPGYYIQGDIEPYRSMVTGEEIASRSAHREHLREHRLVEIGNETQHLQPKPRTMPAGRKELLIALAQDKLRYR